MKVIVTFESLTDIEEKTTVVEYTKGYLTPDDVISAIELIPDSAEVIDVEIEPSDDE